jgi:hypothetical protein
VTGLDNGTNYAFTVKAHNAVGWSDPSASVPGQADALTGPPVNPVVVLQRDRQLTVKWARPAPCDCSDVQKYRLSWPGGVRDVSGSTLQAVIPVGNGDPVTVRIMALNKKGVEANQGPSTSVTGTGAGAPVAPAAPTLSGTNVAGGDQKSVTVSWSPVAANGPGPVSYEVSRGGAVICTWRTDSPGQERRGRQRP